MGSLFLNARSSAFRGDPVSASGGPSGAGACLGAGIRLLDRARAGALDDVCASSATDAVNGVSAGCSVRRRNRAPNTSARRSPHARSVSRMRLKPDALTAPLSSQRSSIWSDNSARSYLFRGFGATALKSDLLLFVSVAPFPARIADFVAEIVGAAPLPS